MRIRVFFHNKHKMEFSYEAEYVPRVGDHIGHPWDAWYPEPFKVIQVMWSVDQVLADLIADRSGTERAKPTREAHLHGVDVTVFKHYKKVKT